MFVLISTDKPGTLCETQRVLCVCSDARKGKALMRKHCRTYWKTEPRNGCRNGDRCIATNISEKGAGTQVEPLFTSEFRIIDFPGGPGERILERTLVLKEVPLDELPGRRTT